MKLKLTLQLAVVSLAWLAHPLVTNAQSTVFTYQGRLDHGANPASGVYDMRFVMFDALSGGGAQGPILSGTAIGVTNGLFTVQLDFGNKFSGEDRWLEIAVRTNGGSAFTSLAPRQQITATPYAVRSLAAGVAYSLPGIKIDTNRSSTSLGSGTVASGNFSIASGFLSVASGVASTALGSGSATANYSTALGYQTIAGNSFATAMGDASQALGNGSTAMGRGTVAAGAVSLSAGTQAKALHDGAFVWADNQARDFASTGSNQFLIRASGGVGINNNNPNGAALAVGGDVAIEGVLNVNALSAGVVTTPKVDTSEIALNGRITGLSDVTEPFESWGRAAGYAFHDRVLGDRWSMYARDGSLRFFTGGKDRLSLYADSIGTSMAMHGALAVNGTTALNGAVTIAGDTSLNGTVSVAGDQFFGTRTRQMLNLYGTAYGIGVQGANLYFRTDGSSGGGGFAWYQGGTHNNAAVNPGGGEILMHLDSTGSLSLRNELLFGKSRLTPNQGGSIELGPAVGAGETPFIDFHYGDNLVEDYNVRLINDGNRTLSIYRDGSATPLAQFSPSGLIVNGSLVPLSDRNAKENFEAVNAQEVLSKVASLPLTSWNYKDDASQRHLGPMAQDFHAAFNLGPDEKHIATVDADGVALAAIQGLNQKLEAQRAENDQLKARLERLENLLNATSK